MHCFAALTRALAATVMAATGSSAAQDPEYTYVNSDGEEVASTFKSKDGFVYRAIDLNAYDDDEDYDDEDYDDDEDLGDDEDYGDDEVQDIDSGTNGISGTLELNMISLDNLSKLLGWDETAATTGTPKIYHVTDEASPYVGFGYYKKDVASGGYVARWIYRCQFTRTNETSRTKTQQVEWNHPTLEWRGTIVHLSAPAGKGVWNDEAAFETREAAKAWLNTKAGISAQSSATQGSTT